MAKEHLKPHLLMHLEAAGLNVKVACQKAKISRITYYDWFKKDKAFREKVRQLEMQIINEVESALLEAVVDPKGAPILKIFWLLNRAPERWQDKRALNANVQVDHKHHNLVDFLKQAAAPPAKVKTLIGTSRNADA